MAETAEELKQRLREVRVERDRQYAEYTAVLERERELREALAECISPIPRGTIVEIPQPRYGAGRYRVIGFQLEEYGDFRVRPVCQPLKKDGTDAKRTPVRLWVHDVTVIQLPGEVHG